MPAWLRAARAAARRDGRDSSCWSRTAPSPARPTGWSTIRPSWRSASAPRRAHRPRRCRRWSTRRSPSTGWPAPASPASSRSTSRRPSPPCTRWRPRWACRRASSRPSGCSRRPTRLATPSEIVFRETGCWGVAEGAALAAVGPEGRLLVPKRKGERVTCAVALGAARPRPGSDRPAAGPARRRRPRARRPALAHGRGRAPAGRGRGAGRLRPLSRPDRARRRRQAAPRVPARRRGRALPLRAGARRRGPRRRPGLLGRSRHLRPGDAGVRAAGERRRIRPGRASRSTVSPGVSALQAAAAARRRAARPRFLRHLALRPADARSR